MAQNCWKSCEKLLLMIVCEHIKAKGKPDYTPLYLHLEHVSKTIVRLAEEFGFDRETARLGAILHDIGKTSPIFQERLKPDYKTNDFEPVYRHELSSLFFLSLFDENIHPQLIEMIVSHHKSVEKDPRNKGILDLEENIDDVFELHKKDWDNWSKDALEILKSFGIKTHKISIEEAEINYYKAVDYVKANIQKQGYSEWKGLNGS